MSASRTVVGVDGCPAGWIALILDSDGLGHAVAATLNDLMGCIPKESVVAIDIPIGLPSSGSRACDVAARQLLGAKRRSSVFPAPVRGVLAVATYEQANQIHREIDGRGLTKQTFGIMRKIREVDDLQSSYSQLVEVHPEVSFTVWNGGIPLAHGKKTAAGKAERRAIIGQRWPGEDVRVLSELRQRKIGYRQVAEDDLLDAFAALWTGTRVASGEARAAGTAEETDDTGVPMRILY